MGGPPANLPKHVKEAIKGNRMKKGGVKKIAHDLHSANKMTYNHTQKYTTSKKLKS